MKYKIWDKENKLFVGSYSENLNFDLSSGQIYQSGINVTSRYELLSYTGLKAKGNIEIYLSDIIKNRNSIYEVVWHDNGFKRKYTFRRTYQGESWIESSYFDIFENGMNGQYAYELIGNIFENPELLTTE